MVSYCISMFINELDFFFFYIFFLFWGLLSPIWQNDKQYLTAFLGLVNRLNLFLHLF